MSGGLLLDYFKNEYDCFLKSFPNLTFESFLKKCESLDYYKREIELLKKHGV